MKTELSLDCTVREFAYGGAEYEQACVLRDAVLRIPLGRSLFDEDLSDELEQRHFGLFRGENLIACAVAIPSKERAKVRQVAVQPSEQGQGHGQLLMESLAEIFRAEGLLVITLHARREVLPFYLALGYGVQGPEFEEVGLPHLLMSKRLTAR